MNLFRYSLLILPREKRRAVQALADFLAHLSHEIHASYGRGGKELQQEVPRLMREVDACRQFGVPKSLFVEYMDGISTVFVRRGFRDWTQLRQHFHKTGGAPALMLASILGIDTKESRKRLLALAEAWELTDVLINIRQALHVGLINLPQDEMVEYGVTEKDLLANVASPAFLSFIDFQCGRIARLLEEGRPALQDLPEDGSRRWAEGWLGIREEEFMRLRERPELILSNPGALRLGRWAKVRKFF